MNRPHAPGATNEQALCSFVGRWQRLPTAQVGSTAAWYP